MINTTNLIADFLSDGGYADMDDWMADSDYVLIDGTWCDEDGNECDPETQILTAIDACGFDNECGV